MKKSNQTMAAISALLFATSLWGLSFPVMKIAAMKNSSLVQLDFFQSSLLIAGSRFIVAALAFVLLIWSKPSFIKHSNIKHGFFLALFCGSGLILQLAGLHFISASASAFLTALYCLWVPLSSALALKRWPSWELPIAAILAITGLGLLLNLDFQNFQSGFGEGLTILSSFCFSAQIIWINKIDPRRDDPAVITFWMCLIIGIISTCGFIVLSDVFLWQIAVTSIPWEIFILALFSTATAFYLMNRFQSRISPGAAGVLYTAEPVFAVIFVALIPLLIPGLSTYTEKTITLSGIFGGILILFANLLVIRMQSHNHH